MALTICPECKKEISSEAKNCIHCGKPFIEVPQTIELTSKRWKIVKLIAWIGLIMGIITFGGGAQNGGFDNLQTGLGITIAIISFIALMIGKFGTWWSNKLFARTVLAKS